VAAGFSAATLFPSHISLKLIIMNPLVKHFVLSLIIGSTAYFVSQLLKGSPAIPTGIEQQVDPVHKPSAKPRQKPPLDLLELTAPRKPGS